MNKFINYYIKIILNSKDKLLFIITSHYNIFVYHGTKHETYLKLSQLSD